MKRLKGPELKLSELKVPPILHDLYRDLRDRRLLPLVGLILVAIVATPFLLGGAEESPPAPSPAIGGGAARDAAALTVLPAQPGLRDPDKRLAGREAKDPFVQKYSGPVLNEGSAPVEESAAGGGSSGPVVEGSGGSGSSGPVVEGSGGNSPAPAPVSPPAESGGGGPIPAAPDGGEIRLFTFAVDLKISHTETTADGKKKMSAPEIREEVLPTTPLPGKKSPALTYLGADPKSAKKALMLVSPEVESLLGDGRCVSGTSSCQLLALEPEVSEVVEYGPNGVRYKIEVLKIYPVISGHISAKDK
ncbi:MAG TPA: hypothetical protein VGW80_11335 [Solirubrobacterales bacterium]|nr:hypothetical protein [Solirubrobacterales bacterium]